MTAIPLIILTAALTAGNAELDRVAALAAARLHIQRFAPELAPPAVLVQTILADPAAHRAPADSETLCRAAYTNAIEKEYNLRLPNLRTTLGLSNAEPLPLPDNLRDQLLSDFPGRFRQARAEAVARQARTLVADIRPTEAELETLSRDALRDLMRQRLVARQSQPLLQENLDTLTRDHIDPILDRGYAERQTQRDTLAALTTSAALPQPIADHLLAQLQATIAERNRTLPPAHAWSLFPSLQTRDLPNAVTNLLLARARAHIQAATPKIDPDTLRQTMLSDLEQHRTRALSLQTFTNDLTRQILPRAADKWAQTAPPAERQELNTLALRLLTIPPFSTHLATHLHATLADPFNQARAAYAERLAADTWPTLFDHTYTPPIPFADTLLSDPNAPSRIKNWRRLEPLKPLAEAEKNRPLPEEAARLADQQIARLFALARQARDGQNRQLDLARQPTLDAARKEQLDLDATTQRLRSAVLQAWEQARLPLLFPSEPRPENANEQYTTLFPSVEERLQLIAREILDQIRQEAQAAAPTPPPEEPPPEQPPEETPPEEKPEEEDELFSLSIQRLGSDLQISIRQGQKTIRQMTVPARAKTFKEAMRKAVQTLSSEVLSLD